MHETVRDYNSSIQTIITLLAKTFVESSKMEDIKDEAYHNTIVIFCSLMNEIPCC